MDYISKMRRKIGHDCLVLVASNLIISDKEGYYYFQERSNGELSFFGGFVDLDETILEGLQREVIEEAGLKIETNRANMFGIYSKHTMQYPNGDIVKPYSLFFTYQLQEDEELEAVPPETHGIVRCKLRPDLPMINVQHRDVLDDLIANVQSVVVK